MSSDVAIAAEHLTKLYAMGTGAHSTLLSEALRKRLRKGAAGSRRGTIEMHRALDDVSFTLGPGEALGVIGRNGAGKSTLLKVLSRITEPTSGLVEVHGRLGCLLEVGTGFHPELTGRENIYLNGAILGMHRAEIDERFDQIVDFSGVNEYLDTPVKRYSSGMYVRLAFAVAAHFDPDVLVVDEVLAVGDAEFQQRCMGRMQEATAVDNRAVIFVSHNPSAILALCTRCLVLENGRIAFDGPPSEALQVYSTRSLGLLGKDGMYDVTNREHPIEPGRPLAITALSVGGPSGPGSVLATGRPATFSVCATGLASAADTYVRIHIVDEAGHIALASDSRMASKSDQASDMVLEVDCLPLLPGRYGLEAAVGLRSTGNYLDYVTGAVPFEVGGLPVYDVAYVPAQTDGSLYLPPQWRGQ